MEDRLNQIAERLRQFKEYTIQELTKLMDEAIRNEDYEQASKFRDLLKAKKK